MLKAEPVKKTAKRRLPIDATPSLANQTVPFLQAVGVRSTDTLCRKRSSRRMPQTKEEKQVFRQEKWNARKDTKRFKGQTKLEQLAVSQPVALDYQKRVKELKLFAKQNGLNLSRKSNFDVVCCKFVNNMFEQGFDLQDGTKSLAAIIDAYPDFGQKGQLFRTRRALQGWSKVDPQKTRPPIPWPLVATMVMMMLRKNQKVSALAVMLMFTGYLRPGETLDLQRRDLVPPMPGSKHFALHLHPAERHQQSKVGLSDESMLLDSPMIPWLGKQHFYWTSPTVFW